MAEYPSGVSEGLSGDDRARLKSTEVPRGYGRTRTVADLVVGCAARISRLGAGTGCSQATTGGTPTTWSGP